MLDVHTAPALVLRQQEDEAPAAYIVLKRGWWWYVASHGLLAQLNVLLCRQGQELENKLQAMLRKCWNQTKENLRSVMRFGADAEISNPIPRVPCQCVKLAAVEDDPWLK